MINDDKLDRMRKEAIMVYLGGYYPGEVQQIHRRGLNPKSNTNQKCNTADQKVE
jgi:hypothetical protein